MSTIEKLSELESRRTAIINSLDKPGARNRISKLLDENSFVEIGTFVKSRSTAFDMDNIDTPADGVVTGYGTVKGRPVYIYSQDASVLGGSIGEMHSKKIVRTYKEALKVGAPVVAFLDTSGLRLQESVDALEGYGAIYSQMAKASSKIPQITIVNGECAGGASFICGLSDYVFMNNTSSKVFLNSPNTMEDSTSFDDISTGNVHLTETGLVTAISENEDELISKVADLLSYLPQNSKEMVPFYEIQDDLNRVDAALNNFDFDNANVKDIVISIADQNQVFELGEGYGEDTLTAFIRMDGGTVGVVANVKKRMSYKGVKKTTEFVSLCNTYNIPIVTLTDIEGFDSNADTERRGIISECAKMVKAFASSEVCKLNVIVGNAYGSGYVAMNSQMLGCDMTYAWPTAVVAPMNANSAMKIMYGDEVISKNITSDEFESKLDKYEELNSNAYACAARGLIDDVIEPAATRKRVIAALQVLSHK